MVEAIFRLYLPHLDEVLGIKIAENVILKGNMLGFLSLLKLTIYIINFFLSLVAFLYNCLLNVLNLYSSKQCHNNFVEE